MRGVTLELLCTAMSGQDGNEQGHMAGDMAGVVELFPLFGHPDQLRLEQEEW